MGTELIPSKSCRTITHKTECTIITIIALVSIPNQRIIKGNSATDGNGLNIVDNVVNKVAKNADAEPNAAIIIAIINAIKKPIKITHNELSVCSPRVPKRTSLTVFTTTLENGGRK